MTRLNLIPVHKLTDQHLFSEWREIKMVPKALRRSISSRGVDGALACVPPKFTLGTGHVRFFYDKGAYLHVRYQFLTNELARRGTHDFNRDAELDPDGIYRQLHHAFHRMYIPTQEAIELVKERIANRIAARPSFYRYYGEPYSGD